MDKPKLQTPDFVEANAAKLAELFPNCFTESKTEDGSIKRAIDFDLLKQELSKDLVEGPQERYRLDWPGKRESLALANAPITKTLRPCKEESVDFETTKNLYIEGDNLDALKLLQETYLGKVKMIYIDPPYNTGNDFIYDDNFSMCRDDYEEGAGEVDEVGNALFNEEKWRQNSSASGRFHSEWLSMMYPRLKLSRNLLANDGVILISIDDTEAASLKRICDEVFGQSNFVANVIWRSKDNSNNDAKQFSLDHNHILIYSKERDWCPNRLTDKSKQSHFKNPDNDPKGPYFDGNPLNSPNYRENLIYELESPQGYQISPPKNGWRWSKRVMEEKIASGEIRYTEDGKGIRRRTYLRDSKGLPPSSLWSDLEKTGHNRQAKYELMKLLGADHFDTPKPVKLLSYILSLVSSSSSDIVLDFFSGSATTAHAVMEANASDCGQRRHIMVQLSEPCDEKSEVFKAGHQTIAEIGKERIRRAGSKIRKSLESQLEGKLPGSEDYETIKRRLKVLDTGFRVFKIDSSNMADVYYEPDQLSQDGLALQIDNVKPDRKPEDLLFQVLLDWGVDLGLPITEETIEGKTVLFVDDNALTACLDTGLTEDFCKALAKREPLRAVFRDSGYATDSTKINIEQIFKALSPHTELKTL